MNHGEEKNMGRMIDADKLIDGYKHMGYDPAEHPEDSYWEGWCIGFNNAVSHCISHVIYAPTVEERNTGRAVYQAGYAEGYKSAQSERKTGKWIKVHGYCTPGGDPVWACSECGKGVHVYGIEHGTYGADISDGQWKACPNCSALMEGEQA